MLFRSCVRNQPQFSILEESLIFGCLHGIVVTCQNERSQIRNKEKALEVLKGKLLLLEKEKQDEKINGIKGEQLSNGWGSAKRSYVLCPYTLVKDNNSGYESSNVSGILDGEIEEMLEFGIKE